MPHKYKKMKKLIITLLLLSIPLFSQKEAYNWYFGTGSGITFNTPDGIPKAIKTKGNGILACSSISDSLGNLLFYTNAGYIYYPNNTNVDTNFIISSFHSSMHVTRISIIVRKPNSNYYFIFYLDGVPSNLYQTTIDMSLNNGKGKVVEKNKIIGTNYSPNKITATYHSNGKDILLIVHGVGDNCWTVFKITELGVFNLNSTCLGRDGSQIPNDNNLNKELWAYYYDSAIKISPDGKKIVIACHRTDYSYTFYDGWFEICDFDNTTGKLSNPITIDVKFDRIEFKNAPYRGVEFSPDSKKLYIFSRQYDLTYKNKDEIIASEYKFIRNSPEINFSSTPDKNYYQLGPDGKIYIIGFGIINVINNPNEAKNYCNVKYPSDSIYLALPSRPNDNVPIEILHLPQFISSWFKFEIKATNNSKVCEGDRLELYATDRLNANYTWNGPNGFSSNEQDPIIDNTNLSMCGWYYVTASRRHDEISSDSTFVEVVQKPDFRITPSDSVAMCRYGSVILTINKPRDDYKYFWSTSDTTAEISVNQEGKYYIIVADSNGCTQSDSVKVYIKDIKPEIEIIGNNPACDGDTVILKTTQEYEKYDWSSGDTTREIITTKTMYCTVSVIDSMGCAGTSDEVIVIFNSTPKTILKGIDRVCLGAEERYFINSVNKQSVLWEVSGGKQISNSGTDTITVKWDKPGQGKVVVKQISSNGCIGKDSIEVYVVDDVKPEILPKKTIICGNGNLTLSTLEKYAGYEWSTGETTEQITVSTTGEYWVLVKDIAGCEGSDTVQVTQANEPQPNITGNLFLCDGETTVLSVSDTYESYLWNTGETTKSITVSIPGTYSVEVTDSNGCKGSASIEVKMIDIEISGLNDLDFGRIGIGFSSEKNLILKNLTNEPVTINRIYSKAGVNAFDLTTNPALPLTLAENGNIEIDIDFEPKDLQEFVDSIIVEITEPCELNLTSELRGIGTAKMLVWLPHLYYPVDTNICIPITAKLISNNPLNIETQFNTTISYEMSAFYPNIPFQKVGDEIHVKLENQELNISTSNKVIGEICGGVMLANQRTTDLLIKEFTTINPYLDIETQNGSLTIDGCVIDLSRIKIFEPFNIVMMPNPASDEITLQIKSHDASLCKIIFYNSLGMEVKNININLISGMNELKIDVNDLSGGVYIIVINDGAEVRKQMFIKE
jgi:hypothetical protein